MSIGERRTLGFDRPLDVAWLDLVANQLAAGASSKDARQELWRLLDGVVAGTTPGSARGKTLTVLSRIWLTVPPGVGPLRDSALRIIGRVSVDERLAIHWALMSAAYPFFVDIASNVGKLIALNGDVSVSQVTRRLVEVWGDRSTLQPAAQRVVRSMMRWGVLREGERRGQYRPTLERIMVSAGVAELVVEGLLLAADRGMLFNQLLTHPAAFPFDLRLEPTSLRKSERLRLHRQGDQTDFVERQGTRATQPEDIDTQGSPEAKIRQTSANSRLGRRSTGAADEVAHVARAPLSSLRQAYARMDLGPMHTWMRKTEQEVDFAMTGLDLRAGARVLDVGCGMGRHSIELAARGCDVVGIDFVKRFIDKARGEVPAAGIGSVRFVHDDARTADVGEGTFDAAVCLYDVVGTYPEQHENQQILDNIRRHLKPGGRALVSVLNMELTRDIATLRGSVERDPGLLLALPASTVMKDSGQIFNPAFFMLDEEAGIVYRREQFDGDGKPPGEYIVRDRRYTQDDVRSMCAQAHLRLVWIRPVALGKWDEPIEPTDTRAKELVFLVERASSESPVLSS